MHLKYKSKQFTVQTQKRLLHFFQPENLYQLIDDLTNEQAAKDKYQPYWVENWPSADTFLSFISSHSFTKQYRVIELGSGLGVLSAALLARGHSVITTDIAPDACLYSHANLILNNLPPQVVCCDMQSLPFKNSTFDLIIASDILYEEAMYNKLFASLSKLLTRTNRAWIADPCRRGWDSFKRAAAGKGYTLKLLHSDTRSTGLKIEIIELTLKKSAY